MPAGGNEVEYFLKVDGGFSVYASRGGDMLAAVGGFGIVGVLVVVLIVIVIIYFVRRG